MKLPINPSAGVPIRSSVNLRALLSVDPFVRRPVNALWKLPGDIQNLRRVAAFPPRRESVHSTVSARTFVSSVTYGDFRNIHSSGDYDGVYIFIQLEKSSKVPVAG